MTDEEYVFRSDVQTGNAQRVGASINAPTPERAAVSKCRLIT